MTKLKSLPVFILISLSAIALVIFVAIQTRSSSAVEATAVNDAKSPFPNKRTPAGQLIGYRHKGVTLGARLPNGAKDLGGGLLSDMDYGVSRFSKGGKFMLWLEKIVDRDERGVPEWEVKDVLVFNKLKKNQVFLYSYSSPCSINGEEDLDLVVMAEEQPKKLAYKILKAWRANVQTEKFEEISTDAIVCEYDAKQSP